MCACAVAHAVARGPRFFPKSKPKINYLRIMRTIEQLLTIRSVARLWKSINKSKFTGANLKTQITQSCESLPDDITNEEKNQLTTYLHHLYNVTNCHHRKAHKVTQSKLFIQIENFN